MELTTILIIGIVIVALISISAGIISVVAISKSNQSSEIDKLQTDFTNFKTSVEKLVVSQAQSLNTGTRGLQGPRGPVGPQGPPGMGYSAAGQLLNMATKTVATPTAGKDLQSIVYLDNKNYSPIQYWFLENNGDSTVKIKNKKTDFCLESDTNNQIYSAVCNKDKNEQNFIWNQNMQLESKSNGNKCISIQPNFQRGAGLSNESLDPTTGSAVRGSNQGSVNKIILDTCSSSINPNQTWFVGS